MKTGYNNNHIISLFCSGKKIFKNCIYDFINRSFDKKIYELKSLKKIMETAVELDEIFGCKTAGKEVKEYWNLKNEIMRMI